MDNIILSNACHKVNGSIPLGGISAGEECVFCVKNSIFRKKEYLAVIFA